MLVATCHVTQARRNKIRLFGLAKKRYFNIHRMLMYIKNENKRESELFLIFVVWLTFRWNSCKDGGVNSTCHPSEVCKMSASMLLSCVGVVTRPGLCPIAKETA